MARYLCGYCLECGKVTKQEVVHCNEGILERIGIAIFTSGFSELLGDHDYSCKCTECGSINTISH